SKVKVKIAMFFAEKNGEFHVSDVSRMLKISKSRASECLRDMAGKGILEKKNIGKSVVYSMASTAMAKMIVAAMTQEKYFLDEVKKEVIRESMQFKPASLVIFGSSLKGLKTGSDIDFLLVHEDSIEKEKIYRLVAKLSEKYGFHISILPMRTKEFKSKAKTGEEFVLNIMANGKVIYGKDMEKIVWQEK
ncbi:MAG: nucleotidyltransferase domain-containing protein, partial [Candidatus Aenigmarchaeota archaeon]|nr:nucleotidyltransferase domain-containing protein [Candidatus Aenigmarchaeota archaeon]MDI6722837.1 nucleotidyltransferase domain-containing protein [Candidatus Aenigmarchaeota archaeon]